MVIMPKYNNNNNGSVIQLMQQWISRDDGYAETFSYLPNKQLPSKVH